jgi:uncharacterized alkaline shock family protein YloU
MSGTESKGLIYIADEVVAVIARIVALETPGVIALSGGFTAGLVKLVSGNKMSSGVQVIINQTQLVIDIGIIVELGYKIDALSRCVQANIKDAIENMVGITVEKVNVKVLGIELRKLKEAEPGYI